MGQRRRQMGRRSLGETEPARKNRSRARDSARPLPAHPRRRPLARSHRSRGRTRRRDRLVSHHPRRSRQNRTRPSIHRHLPRARRRGAVPRLLPRWKKARLGRLPLDAFLGSGESGKGDARDQRPLPRTADRSALPPRREKSPRRRFHPVPTRTAPRDHPRTGKSRHLRHRPPRFHLLDHPQRRWEALRDDLGRQTHHDTRHCLARDRNPTRGPHRLRHDRRLLPRRRAHRHWRRRRGDQGLGRRHGQENRILREHPLRSALRAHLAR